MNWIIILKAVIKYGPIVLELLKTVRLIVNEAEKIGGPGNAKLAAAEALLKDEFYRGNISSTSTERRGLIHLALMGKEKEENKALLLK